MGAEIITAIGVLNKASGFYGILSIFTGHPLDPMEWVLNILSLVLLPVYAHVFLTISQRNALRMVVFAYIYAIDTLVSSLSFSIYFIVHWFSTKAKEMAAAGGVVTNNGTAVANDTQVMRRADDTAVSQSASLAQETAVTIVITVALLIVRLYFTVVILSYARQLVRQQNLRPHNGVPKGSLRAAVQYYALSVAESFWNGYRTRDAAKAFPSRTPSASSSLSLSEKEEEEDAMLSNDRS
ncbi:hypothetical protein TRVA0_052S00562 [Trichomonascus vanleenenianus]|uniref:Kei1p n=1 Tax=Trichomonascus vanleenenianus TaxID=2268995 RepID=UPI003ECAE46E